MAEFISVLEEIRQLPPGQHLFCPRQNDDDQDRYEDERNPGVGGQGATDPVRLARIEDTKMRRKKFMTSLQLLAYDGRESEQYQRFIWETLDEALGKCDICIREYYVSKVDFVAALREDYEEEDIKNFFDIINRRDVQRIIQGLDGATRTLLETPEQRRGTAVLHHKDLHALFEALVCDVFLQNEDLLQKHFDPPFKMIQAKKPLKMREILPAATKFLFDSMPVCLGWATSIWNRIERCPTDLEWEWAMKDYIQAKLQHASEPSDVSKLWSALKLILSKLDEQMITYKFFDLHPNVCTTALNHLAKRSQAVPFICQSLKMILDIAPGAFWQGMGSISSQTIVEQIFASPQFNKYLQESSTSPEMKDLDVLSWIPSLLNSLKPANRPAASQTIVSQLFERIDNRNMSLPARTACFTMAVKVLLTTIISFSDNEKNRQSVERLVLLDTLGLVGHRLDEILKPKDPDLAGSVGKETRDDTVNIVKNSIALECQCLKSDFETLTLKEPLRHGSSSYTPEIWTAVINNLKDDEPELSAAALIGVMPLPGLEQFRMREGQTMVKEKKSYNSIFEKLTGMVAKILERISEFKPDHLDYLFRAQNTSMSLIAALFSPDNSTYQAAIEVVKNISGEFGRKEALAHLIEAFLGITMYGLCWTFRRIANSKTFASVPRMLKNGMEILDVLCNHTNGQLRKANISGRDAAAVQSYWSYQWIALKVIFLQTERWSLEVHDKEKMVEVCRDAMQYAEALFDQYDLFASVLTKAKPDKAPEIPKILLDARDTQYGSPLNALDAMSRWLRLRDEYLADTLVSLITNMLYRLKSHQALATDSEGLTYVQEVATKHSVKTILTASQKARLVRALENYFDRPIEQRPVVKKQTRLNLKDWTGAAASRSGASTPESRERSVDEFGDDDIADEDLIEIANKTMGTQKATVTTKEKNKIKSLLSKPQSTKTKPLSASTIDITAKKAQEARAFIENRKREEAARKLRDKEAAAKLRGQIGVGGQTAGQGSGLAGIGVTGKDHSAGPNSLMVSSESESESDSDEELFGKLPKAGATVHSLSGVRKPVAAGPVRKVKQIRSQKDVRARLAPDLSELHRTILSWDFFADTDLPPSSAKDDYTLVTNTFRTAQDYQKTFEPLLILEGWQSFRAAREEGNFKPFEVRVANSLIVDNFVEVNSTMSFAEGKELSIGTSDVVLLSKSKTPEQDPKEPHCLARVKEISRKKGEVQVVYRVSATNNPLRPHLNDKSTVYGVQILSLTPLEREYGALMALQYYDLCEEIINAKPSPILDYSDKVLEPFQKTYEVNQAQAKAVKSALDNDAFTLIQGPPGSGKTKTICALVGAMLTGSIKKSNDNAPRLNAVTGRAPPVTKKILVCAPSNAAVDELVMRLKLGVTTLDGSLETLSIVRLGRSEAINSGVKDVTLEELVNTKLSVAAPKDPREDIHAVMMEHKAVSEELNALRNQITEQRAKGQPVPTADEQLMDALKRKKNGLGSKIDDIRERQNTASRDMELNRKRIQQEILDSAHVLCATLSGSGHEVFQSLNVEFETVIIDEAAQSIELSALIPLKYGCSKCILVGDPKQLPPTVLSREAAKFQYEQSLFARMENNHKKDVHLLDTQYRMHPEISVFPSKTFYDSRLKDGPDMAKLRRRPWHHSEIFAPYRFFDVQGMHQAAPKGHSLVNIAELNLAMQLYERLVTDVPKYDFSGKIGVITPYKGQLKELKLRFKQRYGEDITTKIEFNTTDAFQGRESEIIIFSCVRASTHGIGFLNDIRRMNVGLTRAKSSLWVLGNSQSLMQGEYWRALVSDAKARNVYTQGDISGMLRRPLLTEDMMKDDVDMMDASSSVNEPAKPAAPPRRESNDGFVAPGKLIKDVPRSAHSSNQSTPLPSRPHSSLSRQSSASSNPRPEVQRRDSAQTDSRRNVTKMEIDGDKKLPSVKVRSEPYPAVDARQAKSGVYGPSGGANGLNDLAKCAICGSYEHFSFNCDNEEAKAAALGNCNRCHQTGHSFASCSAPRCLTCGEVGHLSTVCKAPVSMRLTKAQQEEVRKQEIRFGHARDKARERRAEKQLGEHGAKIPMVKSTLPPSAPGAKADAVKRKREGSSDSDRAKVPRVNKDGRSSGVGAGARPNVGPGQAGFTRPPPTGPAGSAPRAPRAAANPGNGNGIKTSNVHPPSEAGTGAGATRVPPPTGPAGMQPRPPAAGGAGGAAAGGRPGPINHGQPMVRKKKTNATDMFVKRK